MINRKVRIFLMVVSCMSFLPIVHAACDYETQVKLAREAASVNANYEVGMFGTGQFVDGEEPDENGNYQIELEEPRVISSIYNLTENLYVTVKNTKTNQEKTYYYADTDNGVIEWTSSDVQDIVKYEIKIFSNHSDCIGTELQKIDFVTPKYNHHGDEYYCQGNDEYYCERFITTDLNLSDEKIYELADKKWSKEISNNLDSENSQTFWEKYSVYILGIFAIAILGGIAIVFVRNKKRSDVL